jgi:hypothetical protein
MRLHARDAKGSEYDFAGWKPDLRVMPAFDGDRPNPTVNRQRYTLPVIVAGVC